MKMAAGFLLALASMSSPAITLSCKFGKVCIQTQGTRMDPDAVIELMQNCNDFTQNAIGAQMLKMSQQEILVRSAGRPMHPLQVAAYAFGKIYESPLRFERKSAAEDTRYSEIAASCRQLSADFANDNKWIR